MDGALYFRFWGEVFSHLAIKRAGPESDWAGSFSHLSTLPNSLSLTLWNLCSERSFQTAMVAEKPTMPRAYLEGENSEDRSWQSCYKEFLPGKGGMKIEVGTGGGGLVGCGEKGLIIKDRITWSNYECSLTAQLLTQIGSDCIQSPRGGESR